MKTIFFFTGLMALLVIAACRNNTPAPIDMEKEKAAIQKILDMNGDILVNPDKDVAVKFLRKYNLPQYYVGQNNKFFFYNFADTTDERIKAGMTNPNIRMISWSYVDKPVIRISPDAKMATVLGKIVLNMEGDSSKTIVKFTDEILFLQVVEKPDSIWRFGDYMQQENFKRIK